MHENIHTQKKRTYKLTKKRPPIAIPISRNSTNELIFVQTHITTNPVHKTN
jgi:hypothetical protein